MITWDSGSKDAPLWARLTVAGIALVVVLALAACPANAQSIISTSAPPVAPADAVRILLGARSYLNMTNYTSLPKDGPVVTATRSKAGDGPFGPFPPQEFRPLGVHLIHGITYRIPRGAHDRRTEETLRPRPR